MDKVEQVEITVMGRHYQVSCPSKDIEILHSSVRYLNEKAETMKASAPSASYDHIMVVSSLDIVKDLLEQRLEEGMTASDLRHQFNSMIKEIDTLLDHQE